MKSGLKTSIAAVAVGVLGLALLPQTAFGKDRHGYHRYHGYEHHARGHGHLGHSVDRMLERFDTNKDKELSQDELNEARKQLLAKHDGDKNGDLTLEEFEQLWLEFMHLKMVRSFQRIDRDGDAKITVDEFLKPFADAVASMDRNDDGVLSPDDEYRHRRHRKHDKRNQGD